MSEIFSPNYFSQDSTLVTLTIILSSFIGIIFSFFKFYEVNKISLTEYTPIPEDATSMKIVTIYNAIKEGAIAFLSAEYKYMIYFLIIFSCVIFPLVGSANNCGVPNIIENKLINTEGECWTRGAFTTLSFIIGGLTSMLSGYIGMRIAVHSNARTTVGAVSDWNSAFTTAYNGGAVMGYCLVSLALLVLYICITLYHTYYNLNTLGNKEALFECIAGYGLGGSTIALFGRVGGGIYTKAADVGADLVGKVEQGIPEDDPRNAAVIADNVGDNVGDVAGMGSDLFGSFAESTCAALVIASTSPDLNKDWNSLMYPLTITAGGIITCLITSFLATHIRTIREENDVEKTLKEQLIVSTVLTTPVLYLASKVFLPDKFCVSLSNNIDNMNFIWDSNSPEWCDHIATNLGVFACATAGLWSGLIIGYFTEYMTSHSYHPVREIASVCDKGAAVNIIYGLSLGYFSTIVPTVTLSITIFLSFYFANMYGIAIAALGILSTLATGLTIDVYGPISDNAGGIAEMAGLDEAVRDKTDALDAAGNTTAAIGKGFAIGSAALVSLALFGAFVTKVNIHNDVNILSPITFSGLLYGSMLPYWFSGLTMKSVGKAAQAMVEEVRRQFREKPGIMDYTEEPDYTNCVKISTEASLHEMIAPGLLVILSPIVIGFLFGVHAVTGLLAGALVSGFQMAISCSNTGGAWDNAKKYIEKGNHGGKGSDAHAAAVTGDTVGDPLKDTSGPALNILMKLMAIISLVFSDFFVKHSLPALSKSYGSIFT